MPRPYIQRSTSDLEALYDAKLDDISTLTAILAELHYRTRPAARRLRLRVERRIAALAATAPPNEEQTSPVLFPLWPAMLAQWSTSIAASIAEQRSAAADRPASTSALHLHDEASFEDGLRRDIESAKTHIAIFSAFITLARARRIAEFLKPRIAKGVKARCVTRPPHCNGNIPEANGRAAISALESVGVAVDRRTKIHQKVCLLDHVVWFGSVNALSHCYSGEETMARVDDPGFAKQVALHLCRRDCEPANVLAKIGAPENPLCERCGQRTIFEESDTRARFVCTPLCGWSTPTKSSLLNP